MLAAIPTTGSSVLPFNPERLPPHDSFNTRCRSRTPAMTSRSRFTTAFASANISKQSVDPTTTTTRRRALQNTLALPLSLIMLAPAAAEAETPISKAETLTSASGVKYQIIKPGSGPTAKVLLLAAPKCDSAHMLVNCVRTCVFRMQQISGAGAGVVLRCVGVALCYAGVELRVLRCAVLRWCCVALVSLWRAVKLWGAGVCGN
mmetsp:Transcript_2980/g.5037  ORF Transcript_2980/g.5037 Transcript_2980/m.5037 type:complete len:204 (+) Transcript_2980:344-955(+)